MNDFKNRIPGLILEEIEEYANEELDGLITNIILILELEGSSQPLAFNVTHNEKIRNLVMDGIDNEILDEGN